VEYWGGGSEKESQQKRQEAMITRMTKDGVESEGEHEKERGGEGEYIAILLSVMHMELRATYTARSPKDETQNS